MAENNYIVMERRKGLSQSIKLKCIRKDAILNEKLR